MVDREAVDNLRADQLRRIAAQDRQALAELYDQLGAALYAIAVRILGDDQEAEEVMQDVFLFRGDLLENIIDPSKVISDQYPTEQIQLKDGGLIVGRVIVQENGKLFVMTSALVPDSLTPIDESTVKSRSPYPVSMMPPGLINSLNADELLDLLAYIQTAGNPKDKAFAK